jgi:hypothetical protein
LITKNDTAKARQALVSLRSSGNVQEDVAEIQAEFECSKNEPKVRFLEFTLANSVQAYLNRSTFVTNITTLVLIRKVL